VEVNRVAESRSWDELRTGRENDPRLAAAIAALLVDYRRRTDQRDDGTYPKSTQSNWRLLARWEQLRG
jgi:hypothetical protein